LAQIFPTYALSPDLMAVSQRLGAVRELETLHLLRSALPDEYTIFHSTHLSWMDRGRPHKREADFLIINKAGQVLMVEQKMGALIETPTGLKKHYDGDEKNVVTQLNEITDALRQRFQTANGPGSRLDIGFLLYCPNHAVRDVRAAGMLPEQIVDARRSRALPKIIQQLLPRRPPNEAQADKVKRMLMQEVRFDPDKDSLAQEGDRVFSTLTDGLLEFLKGLEISPYRLRLQGAAGCGKTRMLSWFAQRAVEQGKRCLVACFNRPLADELREALPDQAQVETIHGIARGILAASGRTVDVAAEAAKPGFWQQLIADATEAALERVPESWTYDTLLVDEGQDLNQEGFDLLRLLLRNEADIVWLEDDRQRLYRTPAFSAEGFIGYRCRDNYRSPQRIARFIQALLPFEFDARNPLSGDSVQIIEAGADDLLEHLAARVERLLRDGYGLEDIVILTGRGLQHSRVMAAAAIGPHGTCILRGYDADGQAQFTPGSLRVETIWRFKGQQAPAVILCELDGDLTTDTFQRLVYVATTRATAHLEILAVKVSGMLPALRAAAGRSAAAG
jgi:hypothetical protein